MTAATLSSFQGSMAMAGVGPLDRARVEVELDDLSMLEVIDATLTIADGRLIFTPEALEAAQ